MAYFCVVMKINSFNLYHGQNKTISFSRGIMASRLANGLVINDR